MRTLYRVVLVEKGAGRIVHLSIAGGRKAMAAYGMAVARLLFDDNDHVGHLHSEIWWPGNQRMMGRRDFTPRCAGVALDRGVPG